MKPFKLATLLVLTLALSACFQTSLGGPTGGTTLSISTLRNPDAILTTAQTRTEQYWIDQKGQADWDKEHPLVKLLLLGMLPQGDVDLTLDTIDPTALYLVTASGGTDRDPNSDGAADAGEDVQGLWHAVVTGQRLIDGNIQVSALSEALYQQLRPRLPQLNDAQILEQLNAAARLTVGDVDSSGAVDYGDVLDFMRTVDGDSYLGDIAALDALSTAVRAGFPDENLARLAEDVLGRHTVVLNTNFGTMTLETLNWRTPVTADNFLRYVEESFYDDVIFHRVIENFVIQGGGYRLDTDTQSLQILETRAPIFNEARWSISNSRGTVAMARTADPDSATSQFYINHVSNQDLDFSIQGASAGYAVFAIVTDGRDVLDAIAREPVGGVLGLGNSVPRRPVVIEEARVVSKRL